MNKNLTIITELYERLPYIFVIYIKKLDPE